MIKALKDPRIWPWMIATVGLVLRCAFILNGPLWYDESFTLLVASRPLPELIRATGADVHPPAYYLIISSLLYIFPWLQPAAVMRGLSLGLSFVTLWAMWCLAADLGLSRAARLAVLAIMAVAPMEIFFSQEGRMYQLMQLLVIWQISSMLNRRWLQLGLCTLLLLYVHSYGPIYSFMVGMAGLWLGRKHLGWWLAMAVPAVLYLPWLVYQFTVTTQNHWIQPINFGSVLQVLTGAWVGTSITVPSDLLAIVALPAVLVLAGLAGLKNGRFLALWWQWGPVLVAVFLSVVWRPILLHRGLYATFPGFALLAGESFSQAKGAGRLGRWLLAVPWLAMLAWQIGVSWAGMDHSSVLWPVDLAGTIYHMEDTSLVTISALYPETENYLITGCPEQPGALTEGTRAALGIKTIRADQLPASYQLAAVIGPMATNCHETIFTQLIARARPVHVVRQQFGLYGVWEK